jgi:hypothetical protein
MTEPDWSAFKIRGLSFRNPLSCHSETPYPVIPNRREESPFWKRNPDRKVPDIHWREEVELPEFQVELPIKNRYLFSSFFSFLFSINYYF